MAHRLSGGILCAACGLFLAACGTTQPAAEPGGRTPFTAGELPTAAGGRPAVYLRQARSTDTTHPQILEVQILPGRGMNIYQIRAWLPGKGEINVLASPPLADETAKMQGGPDDFNGNESFKVGGAVLVPYPNRIRGKLSADGQTIQTTILGHSVALPANWQGKKPGAEKHAMHGLILGRAMDSVTTNAGAQQSSVTGILHAGDFQGHWLSNTDLTITDTLTPASFGFTVDAKNVGNDPLPIAIGWHPYFALPSGDRTQARLHIPAKMRAIVNNYDDVFPTGALVPVAGTPYDFTAADGAPLKSEFLDDCFTDVERDSAGHLVSTITDPAAKYGVRITALVPEVKAFQAYAPLDKSFVAFEPQFNLGDPFSAVWQKSHADTGMVVLQPGQSVRYAVNVELFVP
jgi:aldose 1-epimerase